MRVPITRDNGDGTVIDGTAEHWYDHVGGQHWADFRDLDGELLSLPPGASFVMALEKSE